jgi:hypothetical protein
MEKNKLFEEIRGIRRIVINKQHGGFGLSDIAEARYCELAGIDVEKFSTYDLARDDPYLIQTIRELGETANSRFSTLKIVEIPGEVEWEIGEYDGLEWVAEKHRTWD